MNDVRDDEDRELGRWLRAVRADADPVLWTRVRARIESPQRVPGLLRWAMRPAALATSLALLVATATLALMLGSSPAASTDEEFTSLGETLLAERDAEVAAQAVAPAGGAARDTGGAR